MTRMLLVAIFSLFTLPVMADELIDVEGRYKVEPQSTIHFSVAQIGGAAIEGHFSRFSGTFNLNAGNIARSKVEFSLSPDGVEAADPRVEQFIRSEAVFDVTRYPTVTFVSDKVTRTGDNKASIVGRLTAKGRTRPSTFNVVFTGRKGNRLTFNVTGKMSRAMFGMDVGTPIFSNMVVLDMNLVGRKL